MDSRSSLRRTKVRPSGKHFLPDGHKVSAYITKQFAKLQCSEGHTWKSVDEETRNFYWKKFEEKYRWDSRLEEGVMKTWNLLVADLYKKTLCNWRKKPRPPRRVDADVWKYWQTIWSTPRWKEKSECGKRNRFSEPAGPGTGISKHIGGSRSFVEHAIQLSADLKRKSTCWDLLKKTHEKEDGTYVDARSRAINERMNVRFIEASQPTIEGLPQTPTVEVLDNMYLEVAGGVRKKRLYGIGSQAYVTFPDAMLGRAGRAARTNSSVVAAAAATTRVAAAATTRVAAAATTRVAAAATTRVAAAAATTRVAAAAATTRVAAAAATTRVAAAAATTRVAAAAAAPTVEAALASAEFAALSSRCEALERDNVSLRLELDVLRQQFRHLINVVQPPSSSSKPINAGILPPSS